MLSGAQENEKLCEGGIATIQPGGLEMEIYCKEGYLAKPHEAGSSPGQPRQIGVESRAQQHSTWITQEKKMSKFVDFSLY